MDMPLLNEKQIKLVNWMFNYNRIALLKRNDENTESDIQKLTNYIKESFPEQTEEILELIK